jgi:putative mRNA 3-end processing factor
VQTERFMIHGGATRSRSMGQQCFSADILAKENFYRVMIDCGAGFVDEGETGGVGPSPDLSLLNDGKKIDAVDITHFHSDHMGAIARLQALGYLSPEARVHMSPQSAKVLPFVLQDGLKPKENKAQRLEYDILDAIDILDRRVVIPKPGEYELLPGLKVYIPQMGHTGGNGGIVIPTSSGWKGFVTSDFCLHDQPVTKGALLPSKNWPRKWIPDGILSTDLTYIGNPQNDIKKATLEEEKNRMIDWTKNELIRGQKVIKAAFGNGRGQNIAHWDSEDDWLRKNNIPIYLDGVTKHIYKIFQENRWSERDGKLHKIGEKSRIFIIRDARHREELIEFNEPMIIITTGGMGNFGPIVQYMKAGLSQRNWSFAFTSWLAPGSNGERLVTKARNLKELLAKPGRLKNSKLYFTIVERKEGERCKVSLPLAASIEHFSLSAHGDLNDLIVFIQDIIECRGGKILDIIVLTHGTFENKAIAASMLAPFAKEIVYGERNTVLSLP